MQASASERMMRQHAWLMRDSLARLRYESKARTVGKQQFALLNADSKPGIVGHEEVAIEVSIIDQWR